MIIGRFAGYDVWSECCRAFKARRPGLLGPTVGLAVLIALIGTLYGTILKTYLEGYQAYVPYMACGLITWTFIAGTIVGACAETPKWARLLRHTAIPPLALTACTLLRQLVILGQNLLLGLLAMVLVMGQMPVLPLSFLGGLILLVAITFCLAHSLTVLSLRYRALPQMINGLMQAAFFMTPLVWPGYFLGRYEFLNQLNPLHHLVELLRSPLLGNQTPLLTWLAALALLVLSAAAAWAVERVSRRSLAYWL